jgi:hypothetical protein
MNPLNFIAYATVFPPTPLDTITFVTGVLIDSNLMLSNDKSGLIVYIPTDIYYDPL